MIKDKQTITPKFSPRIFTNVGIHFQDPQIQISPGKSHACALWIHKIHLVKKQKKKNPNLVDP